VWEAHVPRDGERKKCPLFWGRNGEISRGRKEEPEAQGVYRTSAYVEKTPDRRMQAKMEKEKKTGDVRARHEGAERQCQKAGD
jgi:hypothetical protein